MSEDMQGNPIAVDPAPIEAKIALLDGQGLLTGYELRQMPADFEPVSPEEGVRRLSDCELIVPEGCDLRPEKYFFRGGVFVPVPKPVKPDPETSARDEAVARGFEACEKFGVPLPDVTRTWARRVLKRGN